MCDCSTRALEKRTACALVILYCLSFLIISSPPKLMATIPLGLPVSLSVWKNSKNENPSPLAIADAGNNSPRYLAFWVTLPGSKVRRTGSKAVGFTPVYSQQASK